MIVPDVNLLILAYHAESRFHPAAAKWWNASLSGTEPVGLAWAAALGFVRLWTSRRIFANPMTVIQATSHVESWLARPMVRILHPGPRHAELVFDFLRANGAAGNLTTDAHIAALAIESRGTVYSADADFGKFPGVRWVNPLADSSKMGGESKL